MFKSADLFRFLSLAAFFLCSNIGLPALGNEALLSTRRQELVRCYTAELGVKELSNRNDGKRVEEYLHFVGLPKGNPWCAAFVCWALGTSGSSQPRSGWSPDLFPPKRLNWQNERSLQVRLPGKSLGRGHPQAGDVFGIYFSEKRRIAHCGFVDSFGSNWIITVEGNTNATGSREGDGVYRKRRLLGSIYRIANWVGSGFG